MEYMSDCSFIQTFIEVPASILTTIVSSGIVGYSIFCLQIHSIQRSFLNMSCAIKDMLAKGNSNSFKEFSENMSNAYENYLILEIYRKSLLKEIKAIKNVKWPKPKYKFYLWLREIDKDLQEIKKYGKKFKPLTSESTLEEKREHFNTAALILDLVAKIDKQIKSKNEEDLLPYFL